MKTLPELVAEMILSLSPFVGKKNDEQVYQEMENALQEKLKNFVVMFPIEGVVVEVEVEKSS